MSCCASSLASGSCCLIARNAVGAVNSTRTPCCGAHSPKRAGIRRADRLALVHDACAAGEQWRVDDVAVTDHPADIGCGPEHVARAQAVDHPHRVVQRDGMAAAVAHHALWLPGRARGVEDIERVGGQRRAPGRAAWRRLRLRRSRGRDRRSCDALACSGAAASRQASGLCAEMRDGRIEQRLVGDDAARLEAAGGGDDDARCGVLDALGEFGGRRIRRTRRNGWRRGGRRRASR